MKRFYSVTLFLILATATAVAQSSTQSSSQQQGSMQSDRKGKQNDSRVSSMDRRFVTEAAEAGMAEVAHGQLAVQRASNQEVKDFAQRMIDDHTKANQELMQLAMSKGISMPNDKTMQSTKQTGQTGAQMSGQMTEQQAQLKGKHREMMDKLAKLSGADFDREYMRGQVKDHEKAVSLFERQSTSGNDAELKAFAAKTLPTLREHHQMARDIAAKVGANETKASRGSR